jgi:hypothetical protein
MKKAAPTKSLTPSELARIATADELPKPLRDAVVASIEAVPKAAADLRAEGIRVPEPPVPDPFISALRRICWPSERLPARHRQAVAAVGELSLAFARLVVEEARTFSWRAQSPDALSAVVKWILPWAKAGATENHLELAGRALGYRNLVAGCTLVFDERHKLPSLYREHGRFVAANKKSCRQPIEAEGLIAFELLKRLTGDEVTEDLAEVVNEIAEDGDALVLLDFIEGLVVDLAGKDENLAVAKYLKALERRAADSDPWLEYFLRFSAARALINVSVAEIPDLKSLLAQFMAGKAARPQPNLSPQERLFGPFQAAFENEYALRRERALRHLEAIEPLFHEFRTPKMAAEYYWLLVECYRAFNVYQALDYCCDAILAAEAYYPPGDPQIEHILMSAALIRRLAKGHDQVPIERILAVERRFDEVIQPRLEAKFAAYEAAQARRAGQGKKKGKKGKGLPASR